jgi:hypothetical protein
MVTSDAAMYNVNTSPGSGAVSVGNLDKSCFISQKACSAYEVHSKEFLVRHFLKVEMKGIDRSACLARKQFRAAKRPFNDWTSFNVEEEGMVIAAWTLSGFALKSSLVTIAPQNLPTSILNENFLGFNFIRMALSWSKFY